MFVKNYQLSDVFQRFIHIGDTAEILNAPSQSSDLKIWRSALMADGIERMMSQPDWPEKILKALPPGPNWKWLLRGAQENIESDQDTLQAADIFNAVSQASGAHGGTPTKNIHVTLELRAYDQQDHHIGGLEWWAQNKENLNIDDADMQSFFNQLLDVLKKARAQGCNFLVEQISMIISKDLNSPLMTLTPTLHSDTFYGPNETAITSLLETGYDSMGGGMFVPSRNMEELWHLRPISLQTLEAAVGDHPVVMTNSGDIINYSGMIGNDGQTRKANGVPHISSDKAGFTSRLVILMRNKPTPTKLYNFTECPTV